MLQNNLNANQIGYMATQYNDIYHSDAEAVKDAIIDEVIYNQLDQIDFDQLLELYNEYLLDNCDEIYQENIDEVLNELFNTPVELMKACHFGNYSYADEYIKFNGYGNLDSFTDYQIKDEAMKDHDFLEFVYNYYFDNDEDFESRAIMTYQRLLKEGY